jgi:hypothetical protein
LSWHLFLEEYGVTYDYLPEKNILADDLSSLDIDTLKIQEEEEEEEEIFLSGSENNSINNIESTFPIHNALIFKEQAKVKEL